MTKLFKNGNVMSIQTDAKDEGAFIAEMSEAFSALIDSGAHSHDWDFQFNNWLPCVVEIACKMRGYKSDVHEQRVLIAGDTRPADTDLEVTVKESGCVLAVGSIGHEPTPV